MKIVLPMFLCASLISFSSLAQQTTPEQIQQEINDQVWRPFIAAVGNPASSDIYLALHSKNLVRVNGDAGTVQGYNEVARELEASVKQIAAMTEKKILSAITFELRHTERFTSESRAYERGVYKNEIIMTSGEKRTYYGAFDVTLVKENGTWKILVDADRTKGVTEADFLAAKPVQ